MLLFWLFQHDVIVENLVLDNSLFQFLPLQDGEYMFKLMVAVNNEWKFEFKVFFQTD